MGDPANLCGFLFLIVPRIRAKPPVGWPQLGSGQAGKQSFGLSFPSPCGLGVLGVRWGKWGSPFTPATRKTDPMRLEEVKVLESQVTSFQQQGSDFFFFTFITEQATRKTSNQDVLSYFFGSWQSHVSSGSLEEGTGWSRRET